MKTVVETSSTAGERQAGVVRVVVGLSWGGGGGGFSEWLRKGSL